MYKIISWEKYQARTDRPNYPWVKLHRNILTSPHYFGIPENRRWEWPLLLCMANHETGIIEESDYDIGFKLRYKNGKPFDPKPFLQGMLEELVTNGNHLPTAGNQAPTVGSVIREEEIREEKRREENKPLCAKPRAKRSRVSKKSGYPDDFEEFWSVSPKTGSKKRAAEQWKKLNPNAKIFACARLLKQTEWRKAWAKADPEHFIPEWKDMERWIRDARFDDDLEWPAEKKRRLEPHQVEGDEKPVPGSSDEAWARYFSMTVDAFRAAKRRKEKAK